MNAQNIVVFMPLQADDWLVSKDPKMKPKLEALQTMFPQISRNVLQERLAAAEGHLPLAVQVCLICKAIFHQEQPVNAGYIARPNMVLKQHSL